MSRNLSNWQKRGLKKNSGSDGIWARTSQVLAGELLQLSYKAIQIPLRQRKTLSWF